MKTKKTYYLSPAIFRLLLLVLLPLLLLLLLLLPGGCSYELDAPQNPQGPVEPAVPGMLSLRVNIPGVSAAGGAPGTRSLGTADESAMTREKLHVLLFIRTGTDENDASYTYDDCQTPEPENWGAAGVTPGGSYMQTFRIPLTKYADDDRLKAVVTANIDAATKERWVTALTGRTLDKLPDLLRFDQPDTEPWNTTRPDFTPLPLWGQTQQGFTPLAAAVKTISLIRAVARIDVGVCLGPKNADGTTYDLDRINGQAMPAGEPAFTIASVATYNATRSGSIAPFKDNYDADTRTITAASTDAATLYHTTAPPHAFDGKGADPAVNMLRRQIYLPEVKNKGTADNEHAFYIVVGGHYNGETDPTYYRIDFYDRTRHPATGDPVAPEGTFVKPGPANRYDIRRNHAYVVNILRVRGAGYKTAALAAASEPINMETEVYSWDMGDALGNVVTDGQYHLALSAVRMDYHRDGSPQPLSVFTDYLTTADADASGWRMEVIDPATGLPSEADKEKLVFKDDAGADIDPADWATKGVSRGIANTTAALNVGMTDYNGEDGNMERSVTLRFSAGRMHRDISLVQDALSTVRLDVLPGRMSFTSVAANPQYITLRPTPATDVTLYVLWEGDLATPMKYNLTNPADPGNSPVPDAFADDADDKDRAFFTHKEGNLYALLPTKWDADANEGVKPEEPRGFLFTLRAEWGAGHSATQTLVVMQSASFEKWDLMDREGGTKVPANTLEFAAAGGEKSPWVDANTGLKWYFTSYTEEGNYTGQKWLTNWQELNTADYTGSSAVPLKVAPNPGLSPRTMTLQASSAQDGFDRYGSKIIINQEAGDLLLSVEPGSGTGPQDLRPDPADGAIYTLDFGTASTGGTRRVTTGANTDLWWEWTPGGATAEYTPPTRDNPTHLDPTNTYCKNWVTDKDRLVSFISAGKANATTGNSDKFSVTRKWNDFFAVPSPAACSLPADATTDAALTNLQGTRPIPLAGKYYTELQLRNIHSRLDPANVPEDATRVENASKKLRIGRTVPALWHAGTLPFGGHNYVNLGNFAPAWKSMKVALRTNTPMAVTLVRDDGMGNRKTLIDETFSPLQTYEEYTIDQVFAGVEPTDVDFGWDPLVYTLTLKGDRQLQPGQENREGYEKVYTYHTGYGINPPEPVNFKKGDIVGSAGGTMLLDFRRSAYDNAQHVRICRQGYDTDGTKVPGELTYTEYKLDGSKYQRYISHDIEPNSDPKRLYVYYVEYKKYGRSSYTGIFADGTLSSDKPGECWLVQDATPGAGGVVYAKTPKALPEYPDTPVDANADTPWIKWGDLVDVWEATHTCPQTHRTFTGLSLHDGCSRYYTGGNDYRGQMYYDGYHAIYTGPDQPGDVMQDLCMQRYAHCTGNMWTHEGSHDSAVREANAFNNKYYPDRVWTWWPCDTYHGTHYGEFRVMRAALRYVNVKGEKVRALDVILVGDPVGRRLPDAPTVGADMLGTKVK